MSSTTSHSHISTYRRTQGPQHPMRSRPKSGKEAHKSGVNGNRNWDPNSQQDFVAEGDGSAELCVICAEKLKFVALSPCSHKTCHVCAFRQRALYNKKSCLICRTENENLIFTDRIDADYDAVTDFAAEDEKYGIKFTSNDIARCTSNLLKFTCSICDKEQEQNFGSFKKLNEHLKSAHNKTICMICAANKHAFPKELKIYTSNQLRNHQSRGDSEGFKGHPLCAFCSGKRLYSDDELYVHMRDHHEKCHICDKIDPSSPQYFKDYDQLFEHFKNCHYICTHPTCLENKFIVFRDELELQAHILKEHGDMIRGKPRLFQSELSTFVSAPSRVVRESDPADDFNSYSPSSKKKNSNETPKEKKLRLQERAKFYLQNSPEKLEQFMRLNEEYDKGSLTANSLVDAYKELFTSPEADIYLLIHNLSETYSSNAQKFKELNAIYQTYEQQSVRKQKLPSLSRDSSSSVPLVNGVWSANNNTVSTSHGRGINRADLPTLQSLPSRDPFAQPLRSSSYKNLNKTKKTSPSPVVRPVASSSNVNLMPTYLDKKKSSSGTSLSRGNNKLAAYDLPSLPTPKSRVYIPPVNKTTIPDPKKWGKQPSSANEPVDEFSNLKLQSSSSSKKKGKQKQLLFHIGI